MAGTAKKRTTTPKARRRNKKLDQAVLEIKKTSKSDPEAVARLKKLTAKFQLLEGTRPISRQLTPLTVDQIKITRIEVLLPPGFDANDLPPHGGDPADGDNGDPISAGPPYDTDVSNSEDTDGL